jgi:hypothetical protein
MRTFIFSLLAVFFFGHLPANNQVNTALHTGFGSFYNSNSIVFIENQIEFAVFPDGQFDFSLRRYGTNWNLGVTGVNYSFNSGFNYNPYVQYDAFGAVVQIENTPVFYDNFGRVVQIGNIGVRYNRFGRLIGVGGLNVVFNNNILVNFNGFINPFNRYLVYRPWHRFYALPPLNYCVVYNHPYRLHYRPVRHVYYRPYVNNVRHTPVQRRRAYANSRRVNHNYSERYRQVARNASDRQVRRNYQDRYNRSSNRQINRESSTRVSRARNLEQNRSTSINRSHSTQERRSVNKRTAPQRSVSTRSSSLRTASANNNRSRATVNTTGFRNRAASTQARVNSRNSGKSRGVTTKQNSVRRNSRSPR